MNKVFNLVINDLRKSLMLVLEKKLRKINFIKNLEKFLK